MSDRLFMDAVITPNRSLPKAGFFVLLSVVGAANGIAATVFWLMGAWLAPIFLVLDVVALWWAFRISYRSGREAERVQVSAALVTVSRRRGPVWTSPTAFTRVALERLGPHEARLRLSLSGKALTIAQTLSPKERTAFAAALEAAIAAARRG